MFHYMSTIRRCCLQLWKEPQTVFMGSLLCLFLSLPVFTIGFSCVVGVIYMGAREKGEQVSFKSAVHDAKRCAGKAIVLGIMDLACLLACVASVARIIGNGNFLWLLLHAVLLYITLLFLSTSLFRYPMLARNPDLPLQKVLLFSFSCVLANTGYVFLYWCTALLLLLISIGTGVGMVLLLPGGFALIMAVAWNETLKAMEEREKGLPPTKGNKTPAGGWFKRGNGKTIKKP